MDEIRPSLDNLPFEIIEYIFNCDVLTFADLGRLSSVCQIFNCIAKSNKLWQNKFKQKWPRLAQRYDAPNTDWKHEFRVKRECAILVADRLSDMANEFYHQDNVSNEAFFEFKGMLGSHPLAYEILIDELESTLRDGLSNMNLTHKYYAKRALRFMRHSHLDKVWRDFLSSPPQKQTLEIGACLLSQWCQPTKDKCTKKVRNKLDDIARQVLEKVKEICPKHPVIAHGLLPNDEVFSKSLWTSARCKIILSCINIVMFQEMKFIGTKHDFYCAENTFIDKVLKTKRGIPVALSIIYASVAARLGVACLPVNFPGHFLLKWLEHPQLNEKEAYTYIDAFNDGAFKNCNELYDLVPGYPEFSTTWFEAVPPLKVFIRMCWNLVEVGRQLEGIGEGLFCLCNALELLSILNPDDLEHKLLLARVYMHLCINMTEVIALLQEIVEHDPMSTGIVGYMYQSALTILETQKIHRQTQKIKIRLRDKAPEVKYAVGMIMKHKRYKYRCVIYGWDNICTASKDWIKQMGVYNLEQKEKQPFYQVLVDDGTNRYAAQENLEIDTELMPITHIEIGRYFEAYLNHYYEPNMQKRSEYPQDAEGRDKALREFHLAQRNTE